jgi:nitric oxide dioxygenase
MTPEQAQLVRLSFVRIMDVKLEVGRLFYERLFALAPEVKPLFSGDLDRQAEKLMSTLALAIGSLKNPAVFAPLAAGLHRRHVGYGVKDEHYDKVGEALLWALQHSLGDGFTGELRRAWASLYEDVVSQMKAGDDPAAQAPRAAG